MVVSIERRICSFLSMSASGVLARLGGKAKPLSGWRDLHSRPLDPQDRRSVVSCAPEPRFMDWGRRVIPPCDHALNSLRPIWAQVVRLVGVHFCCPLRARQLAPGFTWTRRSMFLVLQFGAGSRLQIC